MVAFSTFSQFRLTTSVAYYVTSIIPSPKWCDRSCAVLTCGDSICRSCCCRCAGCSICSVCSVIGRSICLSQCKFSSFGHAVVERWAATAALLTASAITSASTRACTSCHLVCSNIGRDSGRSRKGPRRRSVAVTRARSWALLHGHNRLSLSVAFEIHWT